MPPYWSRLAFVTEFLVALVAILEVWSEVGGQNHLDLLAWYAKLSLTAGLALVTVLGTMAAVSHERAWNAKTIVCLMLAIVIAGAMAAATYYVHVHENDDSGDSEDDSVAFVIR
jgi:peptidoglycan/LPS O-acetylase OafA/YrhL